MPAHVFHFKQFSIYQDRCAFKVGTDGILLGAWAAKTPALNQAETAVSHALDIGTGTGLIALMLAQRFPQAVIDAIEVDAQSAAQAAENVAQSPWADRVSVINTAVQAFKGHTQQSYDLIVSNPPFFSSAHNLAAEGRREGTRQTTQLSYKDLLHCVNRLLGENGRFCTILPSSASDSFCQLAAVENLHCTKKTAVRPVPHKPPHRHLLQFERTPHPTQTNDLIIETAIRHHYTPDFIALTNSFYLNIAS